MRRSRVFLFVYKVPRPPIVLLCLLTGPDVFLLSSHRRFLFFFLSFFSPLKVHYSQMQASYFPFFSFCLSLVTSRWRFHEPCPIRHKQFENLRCQNKKQPTDTRNQRTQRKKKPARPNQIRVCCATVNHNGLCTQRMVIVFALHPLSGGRRGELAYIQQVAQWRESFE